MNSTQKRIFVLLLFMAGAAFIIFALPNAVASQNLAMVQIFSPDETAPLPYIFRMIAPAPTLNLALRHFVFYDYYYYGFPFFATLAAPAMVGPPGRHSVGDVGSAPGY
jgi:hypothetical protein